MDDTPVPAQGRAASKKERDAVALCRAKLALAKAVYAKRSNQIERNRRWLAGEFPTLLGGMVAKTSTDSEYAPPPVKQISTNLALRFTKDVKAEAVDDTWTVSYPRAGDLPDEITEECAGLVEAVINVAEAQREVDPAIDDIATNGNGLLWVGINREIVDRKRNAGASTPVDDIALLAANGAVTVQGDAFVPGDADGNPIEIPLGCDLRTLAKVCRDFIVDPEQSAVRTIDQKENLELLAQAADMMLEEEMDATPEGYSYGDVWVRRLVYGRDVLWDGQTTTSWRDATWVARLVVTTEKKAKADPAFKPSVRKYLEGVPLSSRDGWADPGDIAEIPADMQAELTKRVVLVEWWDKETGEVHYFTESGCYDGFLERDATYPYLDDKKRPLFKWWFPLAACVPDKHNLPIPEATLGVPPIETAEPHMRQYILFDSADTAGCKKSGRIIEVPSGLDAKVRTAIEEGTDCAIIERPATMLDKQQSVVTVHTYGQSPVDYARGKASALVACARAFDMPTPDMTGTSSEPTVGQEQMAASGSRKARSGLMKKIESWASDLAMMIAALTRAFYTDAKVAELMGNEFTRRDPKMGPDGMPLVGPDGQPILLPSVWMLFKTSSLLGDKIEVKFGENASRDLLERKADQDVLATVQGSVNPVTGMPYKDPRPILDKVLRRAGFGRIKDFSLTPEDKAMLDQMQPQGSGGEDPDGSDNEDREAPGGGRTDGRKAGGRRGPPASPGRQSRGRGAGDHGDESVRAHRVGVA